jgi:hypothetical protein
MVERRLSVHGLVPCTEWGRLLIYGDAGRSTRAAENVRRNASVPNLQYMGILTDPSSLITVTPPEMV